MVQSGRRRGEKGGERRGERGEERGEKEESRVRRSHTYTMVTYSNRYHFTPNLFFPLTDLTYGFGEDW